MFVSFLSSLIAVPLSEEESRFLGVLQGGESVWTGDGDVGRRHAVPVGHQTRPDVGGVGGTEEAAVLQLQHKTKCFQLLLISISGYSSLYTPGANRNS